MFCKSRPCGIQQCSSNKAHNCACHSALYEQTAPSHKALSRFETSPVLVIKDQRQGHAMQHLEYTARAVQHLEYTDGGMPGLCSNPATSPRSRLKAGQHIAISPSGPSHHISTNIHPVGLAVGASEHLVPLCTSPCNQRVASPQPTTSHLHTTSFISASPHRLTVSATTSALSILSFRPRHRHIPSAQFRHAS